MNKEKLIKICNIVAFIFALSFALKLVRDAFIYNTTLTSFPFWAWVLVDVLYYLLPAAFVFALGRLIKWKKDRDDRDADPSV